MKMNHKNMYRMIISLVQRKDKESLFSKKFLVFVADIHFILYPLPGKENSNNFGFFDLVKEYTTCWWDNNFLFICI